VARVPHIRKTGRTGLIFVLGVFLPSAILAWLAIRTLGEQQIIIERQTAALSQSETDRLAADVREQVERIGWNFHQKILGLLEEEQPWELAREFEARVSDLPENAVPFALSPGGQLLSPERTGGDEDRTQEFLRENASFLSNQIQAEVYQMQSEQRQQLEDKQAFAAAAKSLASSRAAGGAAATDSLGATESAKGNSREVSSGARAPAEKKLLVPTPRIVRKVIPQKNEQEARVQEPQAASIRPELSDFQTAVSGLERGILARFVQDHLELIVWTRAPEAADYIFGYMLPADALQQTLQSTLAKDDASNADVLAILNEKAQPVITSDPDFTADWKRPFVATEVGEILPFWEAALYLRNPDEINATAETVRLALGSFIALSLGAIAIAGWLVVRETRQQLELAQKKADFVSNVSHELKTPLTSIRMFAELLERDDVAAEKRSKYLHIINLEAERLSRLINNVLDFARIEKKRKTYAKKHLDLYPVIARLWENQEAHLTESGCTATWNSTDSPWPVHADPDAIAQALINLFSNAEKYGGPAKEIEFQVWKEAGKLHLAVLDSGPGITREEERKIFDAFYRSNNALSSETQGSGLGLTLARKIVEDHRGTLTYDRRQNGGSRFTITLPLEEEQATDHAS